MKEFYVSSIFYLLQDEMGRVLKNVGVSEKDWDLLTGSAVWARDSRVRVQRTLDAVIYGVCDMTGPPRS